MQKVQFNYEVWKNHPEREKIKLVTRSGKEVTEFTDQFVGKIKVDLLYGVANNGVEQWFTDGTYLSDRESVWDLFMILPEEPEEPVMWVNVYKFYAGYYIKNGNVYTCKEFAEQMRTSKDTDFVGTFKLVKQ